MDKKLTLSSLLLQTYHTFTERQFYKMILIKMCIMFGKGGVWNRFAIL